MSTTSLSCCGDSECDCSKCCCVFGESYGGNIQPGLVGPFYNTMGQPLVYYAQVQPQCCRPKRKENRNCFAKAFKWYTQDFNQERKQANTVSPDLTGFATWLDTKYGEYLRESDTQQTSQRTQPQSHLVSTTDTTICPPSHSTTTRRFPRLRSPWSKRKSASRQVGAMPCRSKSPNASCQFILQPQDLTRPASESCYQTLTTYPNKSDTIVMSIEAVGSKKSAVKSRSMTSIGSENITRNYIDVITVQEGPKIRREVQKLMAPCDQKCKVNKTIQELPPLQTKSQTLCEKSCSTKEECKIYEEMLLSLAQLPYDQSKECQVAQEVSPQVRNILGNQTCTTKEMREMPGNSLREESCVKNFVGRQCNLVQNCNTRPENKVRIETEQTSSACQFINTSCDQNIVVKPTCKPPAKSENVEQLCDQTCLYNNNVAEEIQVPRKRRSVLPSQHHKKGARIINAPSKGKSTDNECQCPEEKSVEEQSYPNQVPVVPASKDPACNCFVTQRMPLVPVQDSLWAQNEFFRPGKLKMERISSITRLMNTTCDQNNMVQQRSIECMMPQGSGNMEQHWNQTNPVKFTNNHIEEIRIPTQTRGTVFPCELSSETQQQREYKTKVNMRTVSSKRLNTDIECQCPEEKPVAPPCHCIVLGRTPLAPMQAKQIQSAIQDYSQNTSKYDLDKTFTKTSQECADDVPCYCSETDSLQCNTSYSLSRSLQAKTKSYVSQYSNKINSIKVDVSCQCSENDIKQVKTRPLISYIHKEKKKKVINVSCQCSEENILQYDTPCQYRRNDFENCDATCVYRKLVRSTGPASNVQGTDSLIVKNSVLVRKLTRSVAILISDSVQTSDHSISLEKEDQDYAFFMKIVCADKLNDGFSG